MSTPSHDERLREERWMQGKIKQFTDWLAPAVIKIVSAGFLWVAAKYGLDNKNLEQWAIAVSSFLLAMLGFGIGTAWGWYKTRKIKTAEKLLPGITSPESVAAVKEMNKVEKKEAREHKTKRTEDDSV